MRLGILTGGGDVPGLNPCIKAVVEGMSYTEAFGDALVREAEGTSASSRSPRP